MGYFKDVGEKALKAIDFLASIRFEVVQRVDRDDDIRVRVIYDDQILKVPWC